MRCKKCHSLVTCKWSVCRTCGEKIERKKRIIKRKRKYIPQGESIKIDDNIIEKCEYCGNDFHKKSLSHIFCSPECNKWHSEETKYERGTYLIFERDGFTCAYCGKTSYGDCAELHADHVIPKSKKGPDEAWNLVTACCDCNVQKSNKQIKKNLRQKILEQISLRNKKHKINNKLTVKMNGGRTGQY